LLVIRTLILIVVASLVSVVGSGAIFAESIPPNPTIYTRGNVTVGGIEPQDSVAETVGVVNRCVERCIVAQIQATPKYTTVGGSIINGSTKE
jgi:hypothetical protein